MLKDCKLYVIIDTDAIKKGNIIKIAQDALVGGADIIQLRDKSSEDGDFLQYGKKIKRLTNKYKRLFIINDRVDIARLIGADGVHLGQDDIPIEGARKLLGKKIVGISTHNLKQAKEAERKGADYIGVGPIFKSKTKKRLSPIGLNVLCHVKRAIDIPFFAIGGISLRNIAKVKNAGAERMAVASSAIRAKEVRRAVMKLKKRLCLQVEK